MKYTQNNNSTQEPITREKGESEKEAQKRAIGYLSANFAKETLLMSELMVPQK